MWQLSFESRVCISFQLKFEKERVFLKNLEPINTWYFHTSFGYRTIFGYFVSTEYSEQGFLTQKQGFLTGCFGPKTFCFVSFVSFMKFWTFDYDAIQKVRNTEKTCFEFCESIKFRKFHLSQGLNSEPVLFRIGLFPLVFKNCFKNVRVSKIRLVDNFIIRTLFSPIFWRKKKYEAKM